MSLDAIINTLSGSGCSPFFFTSAIQSSVFGETARAQQAELMESNLEFREHLQDIRNEYARERLDAQLLFRRESYELGRQHLILQTLLMNKSRQEQDDFIDFLNRYWPMKHSVYSIFNKREKYLAQKSVVPLTVYVASTELTSSVKSDSKYKDFCEELITTMEPYNVSVADRPWKKPCQSRLSEAMNVNFIMGGIPTLLIFPYQHGATIGIETASWSFARGLQGMNHSKSLQISCPNSTDIPKVTMSAVKATIGMTRDAYMLAEYHAPILFGKDVDSEMLAIPELRSQIISHYDDMKKLISSPDFHQLCTRDELVRINNSFNLKLLKA